MKRRNSFFIITIYLGMSLMLIGATNTLQDPTRPPLVKNDNSSPTASNNPQALILTGVFIYPNHQVAIINNHPVKIGDKIGEYIVTAINLNTVELLGSGNNKEILQLTLPVRKNMPEAKDK